MTTADAGCAAMSPDSMTAARTHLYRVNSNIASASFPYMVDVLTAWQPKRAFSLLLLSRKTPMPDGRGLG
jgi:hypothetical protein